MTNRGPYLDLIRGLVKGDPGAYRQRCEQLDDEGWEQLGLVVGAAFFLAARRFLGASGWGRRDVIRIVADARSAIAGTGFDLDPSVAERLLAATKTTEIRELANVEPNLIVESETLLVWHLLQHYTDEEMSDFLLDVDALAEEWNKEQAASAR